MVPKIVNRALNNLEKNAALHGTWEEYANHNNTIDGKIKLQRNGQELTTCFVQVRKEIRKHHIPKLKALAEDHHPFLLIVDRLYPNLKKELNKATINWVDGAGNIYLDHGHHFIWIDRHKTTPVKEKKNGGFTKTGLKVVFVLLHDEEWVNKTYREIAGKADVALGNIKHILDGLRQQRFIIDKTEKQFKLINKKKLLDQWLTAFTDKLKPRLHVDNFKFLNEKDQRVWKNLTLDEETFWGGEPGAELLTANLKPATYTLYTYNTQAILMKDYKLKPDPEGNVEVYTPYWTFETPNKKTAPALVVYTDLMATGEPRNANIANDIYERFLTHLT